MSSDNTFNTSEARRCLDDLKRRVEELQMLLESKMSTNEKNWMSDVHKQLKKILATEFQPPITAISARVIHVENALKTETADFVKDHKSLIKKANESF